MLLYTGGHVNLKLDPYEECPCGSEKKYKFCCYQKAREVRDEGYKPEKLSEGRINHEILKAWESTDFKTCFAFNKEECNGAIKGAHSIQNNRILNKISKDGHVYRIESKISEQAPKTHFKKVSKNKASTFFGFCDFHDTEIFKPIELEDYRNEPLQNFLFAFRGHTIEHHMKIRKLNNQRNIFKINPSLLLSNEGVYLYRVSQFDVFDCEKEYEIFKSDYKNRNFSRLRTFHRKINIETSFAVSSSFAVKDDLMGNEINDIYGSIEEYLPSIYLNVYPVDGGTNIIISYHMENDNIYNEYFNQLKLLTDEQLTRYLNYLIIEYTENVFFSPKLIEGLTEQNKQSLLGSFQSSIDIGKKIDLISNDNYFDFDLFAKDIF
ncbi:SEC-C domain-containing protein [Cytobacillus praedii]|uniref:SEC-C domain-containing protein n=1 Tax=Cytobacillus praedii TaxID=1742358 RepID=UPI003F81B74F